jgi:hypothetical protein
VVQKNKDKYWKYAMNDEAKKKLYTTNEGKGESLLVFSKVK